MLKMVKNVKSKEIYLKLYYIRYYIINPRIYSTGAICPCPHPCPCVPVHVPVHGHGHGQGHMDMDIFCLPLLVENFSNMICLCPGPYTCPCPCPCPWTRTWTGAWTWTFCPPLLVANFSNLNLKDYLDCFAFSMEQYVVSILFYCRHCILTNFGQGPNFGHLWHFLNT